MSDPFVIRLNGFRKQLGGSRSVTSRIEIDVEGVLDELKVSHSEVPEGGAVRFQGVASSMDADESVVVSGVVSAMWVGECRRCLEQAKGNISAEVREIFEPDPTEGETYQLRPDSSLNLEPLVREAVMLGLPQAPLCKEDCAGLCAQCGANHNEVSCDCKEDTADPRWAALDALKE